MANAHERPGDELVYEQILRGTPRGEIAPLLTARGMDESAAHDLVDTRYDELRRRAEGERWTPASLVPAALGGLGAAVLGGVVWAWIVRTSEYELGVVAWGIGLLAGLAVLTLSRGRRGLPLQVVAVAAALVGIALGKYLSYVWVAKDVVEEEFGAAAAAEIGVFSSDMMRFFVDDLGQILSAWDLLWVGLAAYTAWRVPRIELGAGGMVAPVVADERAEEPRERDARADLEEKPRVVGALDAEEKTADRDPDGGPDRGQA